MMTFKLLTNYPDLLQIDVIRLLFKRKSHEYDTLFLKDISILLTKLSLKNPNHIITKRYYNEDYKREFLYVELTNKGIEDIEYLFENDWKSKYMIL